jgi:hypothetical protein
MRSDNLLERRYACSLIADNLSAPDPSQGRTTWLGVRAELLLIMIIFLLEANSIEVSWD